MPRVRPQRLCDNVLNRQEITDKVFRLTNVISATANNESAIRYLAELGLLRNTVNCRTCQNPCSLNAYAQGLDGVRWRCNRDNFTQSIRMDSFFDKSHLSLGQITLVMYLWSRNQSQTEMKWEAQIASDHTIVDWCSFLREVCERHLEANPTELGGIDDTGAPIVVEIDESKYFHRKYHRGQWREGHWVFGAIERNSGKCCLVEVPDRRRETLEPIIQRWILPGSRIISDGWRSYNELHALNLGIYQHDVIIHEQNFVDHDDPEVHTENIENTWQRAKRKLKAQYGTSRELFPSYLSEFLWRNKFKENTFGHLINTIREFYVI